MKTFEHSFIYFNKHRKLKNIFFLDFFKKLKILHNQLTNLYYKFK